MECIINRSMRSKTQCTFTGEMIEPWEVVGVRTFGRNMIRSGFSVYEEGNLKYSLEQTSLVKQVFSAIPIVGWFYENPFTFLKNGEACGFGKKMRPGAYEFCFENNTYLLTLHSYGVHSLLCNEEQIAVYKRFGQGNYHIKYSENMSKRGDLLILFAAFVENYLTMDTKSATNSENFYVMNDKNLALAQWVPDDQMGDIPFIDEKGMLTRKYEE